MINKNILIIAIIGMLLILPMANAYQITIPSWNTNDALFTNLNNGYVYEGLSNNSSINSTLYLYSYFTLNNFVLNNNITISLYDSYSNLNITTISTSTVSNITLPMGLIQYIMIYVSPDNTTLNLNGTIYNYSLTATDINISGMGIASFTSATIYFIYSNTTVLTDMSGVIFVLVFIFVIIALLMALYRRGKGE
jgi:hypothetical protein